VENRLTFPARIGLVILFCVALFAAPAQAAPYAAMVMDARTGEVLHSRNADTRLHPASLTKMMTLYIAFEAVRRGEITMDTRVTISSHAANEPYAIGFRAGSQVRLRFLVRAAAIRSSNDAATAIAEAIEGSEAAFARRMNRTARALGMTRTTFRNAHGLTDAEHLSTARDMTTMGRRLFYDYPQYYNIFSRLSDDAGIATVRNTNRALLNSYRGADGIKTGYTRAAGFNLVASAERGDVRILATVFGGQSAAWRNQRIAELFDMGFARAPARATVRVPDLPSYPDAPTGRTTRPTGAVIRSLRPLPRPTPEPSAAQLAAISDAVDGALDTAQAEEAASAAAARVATPSVAPVPRPDRADETVALAAVSASAQDPEIEPMQQATMEVVTRASSTGSRLYGVSLGPQPSERAAERLLLRTALREIGTFDTALRRVVRSGGAYDARFQGMTEDQAMRACARLSARNMPCQTIGPG